MPKSIALPEDSKNQTKYYITAILCNIEPIAKDWFGEMRKLIDYLGKDRIYVSIFENADSKDNTREYLKNFEKYLNSLNIPNSIVTTKKVWRFNKERIEYLAELRNKAFNFLYKIPNLDFKNTKILFFNDIIFSFQDIVKLLGTNKQQYDSVCAMDYYAHFYDTWVSIDLSGTAFGLYYPYTKNKESQDEVVNGEPIRIFSCWNGITILNAEMFEDKLIEFRAGTKLRQSECTLLHTDMWFAGYKRSLINTQVVVAYEYGYYYKNKYLYPWTKNLFTYFYYYFSIFFKERNYALSNYWDRKVELSNSYEKSIRIYFSK